MLFKIELSETIEYAQAKSHLDLLQSYHLELECFMDISKVEEVTNDEARNIILLNTEFDESIEESQDNPKEISLFDLYLTNEFLVLATTNY